jgi:hypothetical protein
MPALPFIDPISRSDSAESMENSIVRTAFVDSVEESSTVYVEESLQNFLERSKDYSESGPSIASSDVTVVATKNLTGDTFDLLGNTGIPEKEVKNQDDHVKVTETKSKRRENIVLEEPEASLPSCSSALSLTPKQLSEIFFAFEGAKNLWPCRKNEEDPRNDTSDLVEVKDEIAEAEFDDNKENPVINDKSTFVKIPARSVTDEMRNPLRMTGINNNNGNSNKQPTSDSLKNECAALKKIIKVDASSIFKLKKALDSLREMNSKKDVELQRLRRELMATRLSLENVTKERDVGVKRHQDLADINKTLEEEISFLSSLREELENREAERKDFEINATTEMDELKTANELLISRIAELEEVIDNPDPESVSSGSDGKVCSLPEEREQTSVVKPSIVDDADSKTSNKEGESPKDTAPSHWKINGLDDVAKMLIDISIRLDAVEKRNKVVDSTPNTRPGTPPASFDDGSSYTSSNGIEVAYSSNVKPRVGEKILLEESKKKSSWCCDSGCNPWESTNFGADD